MARTRLRRAAFADTPEELEDMLRNLSPSHLSSPPIGDASAQKPMPPGPDEPVVPPPTEPDQPQEIPAEPDENADDDDETDLPAEPPGTAAASPSPPPISGDLSPGRLPDGSTITFESRVTVIDAWKYPGSLKDAPDWVDRNWIGWADNRPALLVPTHPNTLVTSRLPDGSIATNSPSIAHPGDYIVRQKVRLAHDVSPSRLPDGSIADDQLKIEVWPADDFEKLFIPVRK
jgi:hypothetical protein